MLTIRLTRKGKKNQPFFRVVVVDKKKSAKGGRAVEVLGYIDPLTKRKFLKKERVLYWISKGAKPSTTIHNLLVSEKVINALKINKFKKSKKTKVKELDTLKEKEAANPVELEAKTKEPKKEESKETEKPVEIPKDLSANKADEIK